MSKLYDLAYELLKEVSYQTSRSSGKGGQNVNKVETKVELYFDISYSKFLSEEQRKELLSRHAQKINNQGILKLTAQESRTQLQNKEKVQRKFIQLITSTFTPVKKRTATVVPQKSVAQRLLNKKLHSKRIANRKVKFSDD